MSRTRTPILGASRMDRSRSCFSPIRPGRSCRRSLGPTLERLEDRAVPAAINLTVTSTADSGSGTLRAAIIAADADPANNYVIGFAVTGTIDLLGALPTLTNAIAINGPGASSLTVRRDSQAAAFRIFTVPGGVKASLSGMTITNGMAEGGGVSNFGTLTVDGCTIARNSAVGFGGGIDNFGSLTVINTTLSGNSAGNGGGGIENSGGGTIDLRNCSVIGNSAGAFGGGIDSGGSPATVTIEGGVLRGNSAVDGGAVFNGSAGRVVISGSTLSGNSASHAGGAVENTGGGSVTVTAGSVLSGNTASYRGGGIDNDAAGVGGTVTVEANSRIVNNSVTGSPLTSAGGGIASEGGTVTVQNSTLSGNTSTGGGGGLYNAGALVVGGTNIVGNSAARGGGGIENFGSLSVDGGAVNNNSSASSGGGINNGGTLTAASCVIDNNTAATGGGIANFNDTGQGGLATIGGGAISGNSAGSAGGGVWNGPGQFGPGSMTIDNVTVTNNTCAGGGLGVGGGIENDRGTVTVQDGSVISGNSAGDRGGGIDNRDGTATVTGNILVSNNSANRGGGLANFNEFGDGGNAQTTVNVSTVSGNSAASAGGGVWNGGFQGIGPSAVTIINSTISFNVSNATLQSVGGGVANTSGGSVTIRGGGGVLGNSAPSGGGIDNDPTSAVTIDHVILSDNTAGVGGAVHNAGTLSINAGSIHNNQFSLAGGAIDNVGTATLANSDISENSYIGTFTPSGGGLYNEAAGTIHLSNCTLRNNTARTNGGGLDNLGTATINGGSVSVNTAGSNGGGIENSGTLVISGGGLLSGNSAATGGAVNNELGGSVRITGGSISGNSASFAGGAIANAGNATRSGAATLASVSVSGNTAKYGGGFFNSGRLTFTGGSIVNNRGGVSPGGSGGGILNSGYGTLTVDRSTIAGNMSYSEGGGILNELRATITNSTISGNTALSAGGGLDDNATSWGLTLVNCTVANNTAHTGGGGLYNYRSSILNIANSTIAGNSTTNPGTNGGGLDNFGVATIFDAIIASNTATGSGPDVSGSVASLGHNLIGVSSGGGGFVGSDLLNLRALLASLGNYGGPTATMALLPGSPAIDSGDNARAPSTDQRGFARIVHGTIDIGAFESRGFRISVTSGDNQVAVVNTAFAAPLVVTVSSPFGEPVQGGLATFTAPSVGASLSPPVRTATIGVAGRTSVSVTANGRVGSYNVTASARGVPTPAVFHLTNTAASTLRAPLRGAEAPSPAAFGLVALPPGSSTADSVVRDFVPTGWHGRPDPAALRKVGAKSSGASLRT